MTDASHETPPRAGKGRFVRTPESQARDARAAELRGEGLTYRAIAQELGYADASNAHRAVAQALRDIAAPSVEKLRRAEGDRLELVAQRLMEILEAPGAPVTAGKDGDVLYDPETKTVVRDTAATLNAARTIIAASARLSALFGLDEPVRTDVNSTVHVQYSFGPGINEEDLT
jgi:hypothetical protein